MKTNQTFSIKRFSKYIISNLRLTYRQTLMMWGALALSIFLISLFSMITKTQSYEGRITMFLAISFIAGILYASFSFSSFRSKEKTITSLMLPITAFERFLYEFIEKFVLFIILYPIVFILFSNFAVFIINAFDTGTIVTVNGVVTFPFKYFQFQDVFKNNEKGVIGTVISLGLLIFALVFAGTATFRKYPLIKTIVFVGAIIVTIIGYFYLIFEKMILHKSWIAGFPKQSTDYQVYALISLLFIMLSLVVLTFAFFKVKEKEAS